MATFSMYTVPEKGQESQYPTWKDSKPNLQTFLDAINKSQPIIGCKFELVWSRWPRTIFFAKNITIPGVSVNTVDINHAGFTIPIPTHVTYDSTEVTMTIIADKEGFHYYDLRNMVLQTGHPLVAGDPRATIGNPYGLSPTEDTIEVRLRNQPSDITHHHWIIHNFHPTGIGDMELSTDSSSFVEFELKGTFTHISYDCGRSDDVETPAPSDENEEEEQGFGVTPDFGDPFDNPFNPDNPNNTDTDGGDEDESEDEGYWDNQDEWSDEDWEEEEQIEQGEDAPEDSSEEEDEPTLDDDDERAAYEALQAGEGKSDKELQAELEEKFRKENPDQNPEIIETRAELALDAAKKYKAKQQGDAAERQFRKVSRASGNKPRIVLCKNKCGWIGTEFGEANETLTRAVRFNHKISDIKCKLFLDNVDEELEAYSYKTSKLTLPQRFGLHKTPTKDVPKTTEIELEDPLDNLDSTTHGNSNPNHKVRPIFPLGD